MTKVANSSSDESKIESTTMHSVNNRKTNYKAQKPILEKRRRDRINSSLDELKNILLAIKQRDPLRYARLEKADILEMVVKYLKDVKKRRQAMVATMEPFLFGSFKLGFMDCTRATIDFLNDIDAPEAKKKMIIEHVTKASGKVLDNKQHSPAIFTQHHDRMFANVNPPDHFMPFSLLTPHSTASRTASTDIAGDIEWPSLHGHIPSPNLIFSTDMRQQQPKTVDVKPSMLELSSLLKIAEPKSNRMSAFDLVNKSSSCHDSSPSTSASSSGGTAKINATPRRLIVHETHRLDMSEDDEDEAIDEDDNDDEKLIIDDPNNNQMTWRPWL